MHTTPCDDALTAEWFFHENVENPPSLELCPRVVLLDLLDMSFILIGWTALTTL